MLNSGLLKNQTRKSLSDISSIFESLGVSFRYAWRNRSQAGVPLGLLAALFFNSLLGFDLQRAEYGFKLEILGKTAVTFYLLLCILLSILFLWPRSFGYSIRTIYGRALYRGIRKVDRLIVATFYFLFVVAIIFLLLAFFELNWGYLFISIYMAFISMAVISARKIRLSLFPPTQNKRHSKGVYLSILLGIVLILFTQNIMITSKRVVISIDKSTISQIKSNKEPSETIEMWIEDSIKSELRNSQ